MLTSFTRKLCPLLSLAIATIGCGKKISETDSKPANTIENSETSSRYVLRFDSSNGNRSQFLAPRDAQFYVPSKVQVFSGSTAGRVLEISYNVNEYDSDYYDFKCTYKPSVTPGEMKLDDCFNDRGSFGSSTLEYEFTILEDQIIEMNLTGGQTSDFIADISYLMDWN